MPEQWGSRPVWQIDSDPQPSLSPWLFWISVGVVVGAAIGYAIWRAVK